MALLDSLCQDTEQTPAHFQSFFHLVFSINVMKKWKEPDQPSALETVCSVEFKLPTFSETLWNSGKPISQHKLLIQRWPWITKASLQTFSSTSCERPLHLTSHTPTSAAAAFTVIPSGGTQGALTRGASSPGVWPPSSPTDDSHQSSHKTLACRCRSGFLALCKLRALPFSAHTSKGVRRKSLCFLKPVSLLSINLVLPGSGSIYVQPRLRVAPSTHTLAHTHPGNPYTSSKTVILLRAVFYLH